MKAPKSVKECRTFCGMVNFLSTFCKNLRHLLIPIYELTKKHARFVWTDKHQKAFEEIKQLLVKPPVLRMVSGNGFFRLESDTSRTAAGATLYQWQNNEWVLVGYHSKRLPDAVRNYGVTELELTGLLANIHGFEQKLNNNYFEAIVDHKAIDYLIKSKHEPTSTRLVTLLDRLNRYTFDLKYLEGSKLKVSDALSRLYSEEKHKISDVIPLNFLLHFTDYQLHKESDHLANKLYAHKRTKLTTKTRRSYDSQAKHRPVERYEPPKTTKKASKAAAVAKVSERQYVAALQEIPIKSLTRNENPLKKLERIDKLLTIKQDQQEKQVINTIREVPPEMYTPAHLLIPPQDKLSLLRKHIPKQQEIDVLLKNLRKWVLHNLMVNLDTKDLIESYTKSLRYRDIYNYITDGRLLLIILLAGICQAYTPITERSWVQFRKVKQPTYENSPLHGKPDIIHAKDILIEERISTLSTMVRKSVRDFHAQMKKYTTELTERIKRATTKADYGFIRKPELRHQYGMLFNHHGQVISGLKNMDLFLSIDLPKVEDIAHVPPPFPDCDNWAAPHKTNRNQHVYYSSLGFGRQNYGPVTELNPNTSKYLTEAVHIMVCNQYKNKYIKLLERIEIIKRNITYKIEKVMPRLMQNENAIIYGKQTQSDSSRQKRAIPLGLIFSGVSAIGGLIMKGVNTWSNYKKSKAMTKAVAKLYEAQEIDHKRLTRLEGQTSLLAKTTKTAFQHIDYRLLHLDTKLNSTVQHMTEFFKRTETHFRFTWEALVSNRLAIHLLSSGSAMYDMVLRQYLHYYQNYDVTLDHFLTGLDALGTGRLTFQVLDPDE